MDRTVTLTYPAPIPVGHRVELIHYADTRPEKKQRGFDGAEAFRHPVVTDLDTGVRYLNHVHVSAGGNGGNVFTPNAYSPAPRTDLIEAGRWRGTVTGCAIVFVEGIPAQHTVLSIAPDA